MLYSDSIGYLYSLTPSKVRLGLEDITALCDVLGNPQRGLRCVHIAGTNGKGSVAAVLASILSESGYRTGLYTSPHLVEFRERIRVNGEPIPREELEKRVEELKVAVERVKRDGRSPTFFDGTTALAFRYFADVGVDVVIVETGLGGRLDSTNVLTPLCSVITGVAMDHAEFLGESLEQIAVEKAGIVKRGVPVFAARMGEPAGAVVERRASEMGAALVWVDGEDVQAVGQGAGGQVFEVGGVRYETALLGRHQVGNVCLALRVAAFLRSQGFEGSQEAVKRGVAKARWRGRFEVLRRDPPLVLDGAHNESGMEAALETWRAVFGGMPGRVVFGCQSVKRFGDMARLFDVPGMRVDVVPLFSAKSATVDMLSAVFGKASVTAHGSLREFWRELREANEPGGVLLAGSLYLVGEALALEEGRENEVWMNG